MATPNCVEDDEWEVVNDDGFVYKRKKRPHLDPTPTSAPPPPDPAAEKKNRRERRKMALRKLKERYEKEIDRWEHLSNTLKAMHEKTQNQAQSQQQGALASVYQSIGSPFSPAQSSDTTCRRLVDELVAQAEAQEAIILDLSSLCDVAEAMCNAEEDRLNRSLIGLPIWATSPRELISSLCEG